jgi:hypothetical protein
VTAGVFMSADQVPNQGDGVSMNVRWLTTRHVQPRYVACWNESTPPLFKVLQSSFSEFLQVAVTSYDGDFGRVAHDGKHMSG